MEFLKNKFKRILNTLPLDTKIIISILLLLFIISKNVIYIIFGIIAFNIIVRIVKFIIKNRLISLLLFFFTL
jgi:hypothetical protein